MSDYIYCPVCGEKNNGWSGFWPDSVFQVRRASVTCEKCGFRGDVVVKTADQTIPKVDIQTLRANNG